MREHVSDVFFDIPVWFGVLIPQPFELSCCAGCVACMLPVGFGLDRQMIHDLRSNLADAYEAHVD